MTTFYRAAIAGCGRIAGLYAKSVSDSASHAGMYHQHGGFQLVAACDPDRGHRRRFQSIWESANLYGDVAQMLDVEKPDIVSITSPNQTHVTILELALEKEVPVILLEKPVSWESSEVKHLLDSGASQKSRIVVNYQRHFSPNYRQLHSMIRQGELGEITHVNMLYSVGLIHIGSHALDLLRWYFGEPVHAAVLKIRESNDQDMLIDFQLDWSSGVTAYVQGMARNPANAFELEIIGTRGRVRAMLGGRHFQYYTVTTDPDYPSLSAMLPAAHSAFTNQDWKMIYPNLATHLQTLLENQAAMPSCSLEDGYHALHLSEQLVKAARNGLERLEL